MFVKDARRPSGLSSQCKDCRNIQKRIHYKENRERLLSEKKEGYYNNREEYIERSQKYYYKNRDVLNKRRYKYLSERRKEAEHRLIHNACSRIRCVCRGIELPKSKMKYLGCTGAELKLHLESMFLDGMSWDNYGTVWHVDHKIPLSWFDMNHEGDRKTALCYTNLQPMFALENIRKGGRRADV